MLSLALLLLQNLRQLRRKLQQLQRKLQQLLRKQQQLQRLLLLQLLQKPQQLQLQVQKLQQNLQQDVVVYLEVDCYVAKTFQASWTNLFTLHLLHFVLS